ncbi:MAG: efflux RND transporter periplasmic adaptor subunit [Desulfobacteraceae bacterium]|nr:MAG: efflux RND transporter periplasmic adaptor subunit [Desulfobacteraceae bacterium]
MRLGKKLKYLASMEKFMKLFIDILKHNKPWLRLLAVLIAGVSLGYWLQTEDRSAAPEQQDAMFAAGETAQIYVCPMLCVPPREHPGDCPICGMELMATPVGEASPHPRVRLAPETVKQARIMTAPVERRFVSAEVRLFGQIEYDPVHISYASAYVPGVIDRIYVKRAGQTVRWGDPLFDIRSPEILMIEEQLVEALKLVPGFYSLDMNKPHVRARSEVLLNRPGNLHKPTAEQKKALETINALRHKLTLIGMEKVDIDELMKKGEPSGIATIYAQRTGIVIEQKAFEGTFVNTGTPVFAIANPKFVWARLEAYESDYPWLRIGQTAEFVTDTYPGEVFEGKVAFIDPLFNQTSRTFDVGVIFADSSGRFRPKMNVRALIQAKLTADGRVAAEENPVGLAPLVIPDAAPLITGKRALVYVAVPGEEGVYEGREIVLGPRTRQHYIVREGLESGEEVVVNGNFKIDSQVQIMAKASMMSMKGAERVDAHHHSGGSEAMAADHRNRMGRRLDAQALQMEDVKAPAPDPDSETPARTEHMHH